MVNYEYIVKQLNDELGARDRVRLLLIPEKEALGPGFNSPLVQEGDIMEQGKLNEILSEHKKWLDNDELGERADLRGADLSGVDLRRADLRWADLRGADLDFSVLPLWCGGKFRADERICKQLVAHIVKIMELSEIDKPELIKMMNDYKTGWHREDEF